jgi:hypothetical protein
MNGRRTCAFALAVAFVMSTPFPSTAADDAICSIVKKPQDFDHKSVSLKGAPSIVKETTSRRGNDYTTFNLQDSAGCTVKVFTWGHSTISTCDQVNVDGVFETEHRQGPYTFYNEIQANKVTCVSR